MAEKDRYARRHLKRSVNFLDLLRGWLLSYGISANFHNYNIVLNSGEILFIGRRLGLFSVKLAEKIRAFGHFVCYDGERYFVKIKSDCVKVKGV